MPIRAAQPRAEAGVRTCHAVPICWRRSQCLTQLTMTYRRMRAAFERSCHTAAAKSPRLVGFIPPVDKPKTTIETARYLTIWGMCRFLYQPIRVLLVDDHRSVLWGLTKLIESAHPQLELVDVATCHSEALAAMEQNRPHVVLLDLDLGSESGFDLVPQLASQAAVLILTGFATLPPEHAVLAGARGVIHKSEPAE